MTKLKTCKMIFIISGGNTASCESCAFSAVGSESGVRAIRTKGALQNGRKERGGKEGGLERKGRKAGKEGKERNKENEEREIGINNLQGFGIH